MFKSRVKFYLIIDNTAEKRRTGTALYMSIVKKPSNNKQQKKKQRKDKAILGQFKYDCKGQL